jgi:hypothetical protein
MAAGSTYTPLATTTISGTPASYTFSSISGSYTDLVLIGWVAPTLSTGTSLMGLQVNGATSGFSTTGVIGTGSAAQSSRNTSSSVMTAMGLNNGSGTGNINFIANFMNYSNSSTYKTIVVRGNNADAQTEATVSLWQSTAAITSILIKNTGGVNLTNGSTFTLYGIQAA